MHCEPFCYRKESRIIKRALCRLSGKSASRASGLLSHKAAIASGLSRAICRKTAALPRRAGLRASKFYPSPASGFCLPSEAILFSERRAVCGRTVLIIAFKNFNDMPQLAYAHFGHPQIAIRRLHAVKLALKGDKRALGLLVAYPFSLDLFQLLFVLIA